MAMMGSSSVLPHAGRTKRNLFRVKSVSMQTESTFAIIGPKFGYFQGLGKLR